MNNDSQKWFFRLLLLIIMTGTIGCMESHAQENNTRGKHWNLVNLPLEQNTPVQTFMDNHSNIQSIWFQDETTLQWFAYPKLGTLPALETLVPERGYWVRSLLPLELSGIETNNLQSPLGINVNKLDYWITEWPLVDAKKLSSGWLPQCNPYQRDCSGLESPANTFNTMEEEFLDLDENGWVKSLPEEDDSSVIYRTVAALMFQGNHGHYPSGQYIVLYEGEGTLRYQFNAVKNESLSTPGRDVLDVNATEGGILLELLETDPNKTGNYIRNIRVIWPGGICDNDPMDYHADASSCAGTFTSFEENYETQRFHPKYLTDLKKYKLIRFMAFLSTNHSQVKTWNERPMVNDATWTSDKGAPIDVALDLVNRIEADAWINVPPYVDDDYVQKLAELSKNQLGEKQKIYLEYSNENWNTAYPYVISGHWMRDQGIALWPDVENDPHGALRQYNFFGKRTAEICAIWKEVWGPESSRIKCVMGGMVNTWINERELECSLWAAQNGGRSCAEQMDAVAIGPYFGGYLGDVSFEETLESWTRFEITNENLVKIGNEEWPVDVPDSLPGQLEVLRGQIFQGKAPFVEALRNVLGEADAATYQRPIFTHAQDPWAGVDQIFQELTEGGLSEEFSGGALTSASAWVKESVASAKKFDLDLVAYEGGQHLVGVNTVLNNQVLQTIFQNANRDSRMGELLKQYHADWKDAGGTAFAHFMSVGGYGPHGSFGTKEYQEQDDSPKYNALMEFIDETPCWWDGCGLGTILTPSTDMTIVSGQTLDFTANGGDPALNFQWNFQGGALDSTLEDPGAVQFDIPGIYPVMLTVRNQDGQQATSVRVITVEQNQTPTITIQTPANHASLDGPVVAFQAEGIGGNGELSYHWDFEGAALPSDEQSPSITFFSSGLQRATVTVTDHDGESVTSSITFTVSTGAEPVNISNAQSALGTGITSLHYGSSEWPLLDEMKRSSDWIPQCDGCSWDTGERQLLDLDENGWIRSLPAQDDANTQYRYVSSIFMLDAQGHYPAGRYVVLYDGEGTIKYRFNAKKIEGASQPGRDIIEVTNHAGSGFLINITETDPQQNGNYLRNIRVISAGGICDYNPFEYHTDSSQCQGPGQSYLSFEQIHETHRFHPTFLLDLQKYKIIRFMEIFKNTENTTLMTWENRPKLSDARWSLEKGIPVELSLALAKRLNAIPWLTLPVQSTDDYVEQFALLAKDTLNPDQKVYLEYSHEPWKFSATGQWIERQGQAQWPDSFDSGFDKRLSWYGKRSAEVCQIWKDAWGEQSDQVMCVMGGNAEDSTMIERSLSCRHWATENGNQSCGSQMDALAIAPYFGAYLGENVHQPTIREWLQEPDGGLEKLFLEITQGGLLDKSALVQSYEGMAQHQTIAQSHGLDLVGYSGGQAIGRRGFTAEEREVQSLFRKANQDAQMKAIYTEYLEEWKNRGGSYFVHKLNVNLPQDSHSWGAKEFQEQSDAPKFEALMEFIDQNPCWWQACSP